MIKAIVAIYFVGGLVMGGLIGLDVGGKLTLRDCPKIVGGKDV